MKERIIKRLRGDLATNAESSASEIQEREECEARDKETAERLRDDLGRTKRALEEAQDRETDLNERLADSETRISRGVEIIRKLHEELRELRFALLSISNEITTLK